MARRVRITAEATPFDYTERYSFLPADRRQARTLQSYKDEFGGGLDGEIDDPFGLRHRISLAPFDDMPPGIFIKLQFVVPREGEEFPPIYSDAVVLKEYALPEGTTLPGA